jgi:hypothetical protein
MNTVTLGEDVRFHTGIPLVGAMSEVDAALKQGLHGNNSHFVSIIPFSNAQKMAWNGVSLAGIQPFGLTRSGTLVARPKQNVLFQQSGEIIPYESCYIMPVKVYFPYMKPILKQLFFLFILNLFLALLIKGATNSLGIKNNKMSFDHAIWLFTDEIGNDSWRPMKLALDYWHDSQGQGLIYSDLLIQRRIKFQYPPSTLVISEFVDTNNIGVLEFTTATTFIFLFVMIAGIIGLSLYSYKQYKAPELSVLEKIAASILLTLLFFTFYPAVKAGTLGQIQFWLNAIFAVAILCYITGYEIAAGILLGFMASIKPQYALFVLWGLFRGNKKLAIAMIVTGLLGIGLGIREFGLATFLDYVRGLSFLSQHGESYLSNQSFNGLAGRFFSVRYPDVFNNTKWRGYYFPPFNFWVFTFTQVTSIAILVTALLKGKRQSLEARTADFCLMGLSATMASPIAWEHHYGILFPIFVCLGFILWFGESPLKTKWAKIAFVACYLVAANIFPFANLLAESYLNVLQSYLFFAACGVFGLLVLIKHKPITA